MFNPRARAAKVSRGQAMAEFALVLPILILLLVMAIDFGRVFYGWVAINNAARIAANEAARNPSAWEHNNQAGKDRYVLLVERELQRINCDADDVDDPDFEGYDTGDHVTAVLTCHFQVITPIAGAIVGNSVEIGAASTFAVFGGTINGVPVAEAPPTAACLAGEQKVPYLVGMSVAQARQTWTSSGFQFGNFTPAPAVDDDNLVLTQTTSPPSSPGTCLTVGATMTVTHAPPEVCEDGEINVPSLVGKSVATARSDWQGLFSGTFSAPGAADTDVVETQTTTPSRTPGQCAPEDTSVTVTVTAPVPPPPASCKAPQVVGMTPAQAEHEYRTVATFTGTFKTTPGNKPTWKVRGQSLVGGQNYPCTANLEVTLENK